MVKGMVSPCSNFVNIGILLFIVSEDWEKPEGFCHWAWNDIYKVVSTLVHGGNLPWMKEKGTSVSCCTDGFRPVIFEIRRIK